MRLSPPPPPRAPSVAPSLIVRARQNGRPVLTVSRRAIEDAVRAACADLVADALVVGSGRPHPVLLVEALAPPPLPGSTGPAPSADPDALAREVVRRLAPLGGTLFPYERIGDARWVLVVPPGALLRNREKGNVRRDACEEAFRVRVDAVFDA